MDTYTHYTQVPIYITVNGHLHTLHTLLKLGTTALETGNLNAPQVNTKMLKTNRLVSLLTARNS